MKSMLQGFNALPLCLLVCMTGCLSNQPADLDSSPTSSSEEDAVQSSPRISGSAVCANCHEEHYRLWAEGGHNRISCVPCHGPAGDHTRLDIDPRPRMKLQGEAGLCLSCHGRSSGMTGITQVGSLEAHVKHVGEKHSVKTDVEKTRGRCVFCHDPHSLE